MKNPVYADLTPEQSNQIRSALSSAFPNGPQGDFDGHEVTKRNGDFVVPVHAKEYPSNMFGFMEGLAIAEINLRDSGFKVRLYPDIPQRKIFVASVEGKGTFAYLSEDGRETEVLAELVGTDKDSLGNYEFEGFPYDNKEDFASALTEAKEEYPSVDFSGVTYVP